MSVHTGKAELCPA